MSREKQIEFEMAEMLDIIEKAREEYANDVTDHTENEYIREALLNAGYRKQIKGEWIRQEKEKGKVAPEAVCSNCGRDVEYQVIDGKWEFENYCSHCGAKMKGGASDGKQNN